MKVRYWGIGIAFLLLLVLAAKIDKPADHDAAGVKEAASSLPAKVDLATLGTCVGETVSYPEPVFPEQKATEAEPPNRENKVYEVIPKTNWSTRVGFGMSTSTDPQYWAEILGASWYIDWSVRRLPELNGPDHWQMVRVHQDCISPSMEEIQLAAANFPGEVWIIGNEPDVIWQDNVTPSRYAVAYHELYTLIKSSDATSRIAAGGISQATPLRMQYLDQVLKSYQDFYHEPLPADWWTVHGYVLREEKNSWGVEIPPGLEVRQGELREVSDNGRVDLFQEQLEFFRRWMAENGYQQTPLALTEFGIVMPNSYGFPPEFIADYLEKTFAWLTQARDEASGYPADDYHLVQKWAWFSLSDPTYSSSNLGDLSSGRLTPVGERFRGVVSTFVP